LDLAEEDSDGGADFNFGVEKGVAPVPVIVTNL